MVNRRKNVRSTGRASLPTRAGMLPTARPHHRRFTNRVSSGWAHDRQVSEQVGSASPTFVHAVLSERQQRRAQRCRLTYVIAAESRECDGQNSPSDTGLKASITGVVATPRSV
jgi:hypothetical protein